eukprot:7376039-Prymnesium_polylepis.3
MKASPYCVSTGNTEAAEHSTSGVRVTCRVRYRCSTHLQCNLGEDEQHPERHSEKRLAVWV